MKFSYRARNAQSVLIRGTAEGDSAKDVARDLKKEGLFPLAVVPAGHEKGERGESVWQKLADIGTIPLRQKSLFFRQMAVLVGAGIPLGSALARTVDACRCRPLVKKAFTMQKILDSGQPLSFAVKKCALAGSLEGTILSVGEETGRLAESLQHVATLYERRSGMRSKILSALTYPVIVLISSGSVVFILFRFVLPRFRSIFEHMNLALPPATQRIFRFGEILPQVFLGTILFIGFCAVTLEVANRFPRGRIITSRIVLATPIVGAVTLRAGLAGCLRLLSVLIECGVPLLRSLELCAASARNAVIADAMMKLRATAEQGGSIGEKAQTMSLLRSVAAPLISAGEQSGQLAEMLARAADWYEADLSEWISRLSSLLEPALILIAGLAAGAVVFAVFAPVLDAVRSLAM